MQPLISVIIPVYNVEEYIDRCVNTVMKHTYKNLEIILVDDGSTYSSAQKCDLFKEKDDRIKVIHKTNGGLSDARNKGMDICSGEYVTFIDSDDWINDKYIELLYNSIVKYKSDISISDMIDSDGKYYYKDYNLYGIKEKTYTPEQALYVILTQKEFNTSADGKLFKYDLINKYRFKYGILYEDFDLIYKIIDNASKISFVDDAKYYYYQRKGSIAHSKMDKKHYIIINISNDIMKFIEKKYPDLAEAALSRYVFSNLLLLSGIICDKEQLLMQQKIKSNLKSNFVRICKCKEISRNNKIKSVLISISLTGYRFLFKVFR